MRKDIPTLYIVTGPTASGKSALAVELAQRLGTEVISADSRQIYRDIPIVTAAPTEEEMQGVRHHFVGTLGLDQYWSAAEFAQSAQRVAAGLLERCGSAVVAGGSMMYIDAFMGAIDELPTVPACVRDDVLAMYGRKGKDWLRDELRKADPVTAARLDPDNMKRWLHALEISLTAGSPYSSLIGQRKDDPFPDVRKVRIVMEGAREELFDRINRRTLAMVEQGLEREARAVYGLRGLNSLNTVGLKEMFAYFDGAMDFDTAVARMQKNTRVFAKKQMTWLKRPPLGCHFSQEIRLPLGTTGLELNRLLDLL